MKTRTQLVNLFTSLSNNTSSTNSTLGGQLIDDQHRYLLQKYFDNEKTANFTTIGAMDLTLTGALSAAATSGTLTSSWSYATCRQLVNFSNSDQRNVLFTNGSTAITWDVPLSDAATVDISTIGVQVYPIPANISKIKNDTITIGQLRYSPAPVQTRAEWDLINFLPYTSDIPNYYFIWNGAVEIFPIPSTTGNIGTFNYKTRVPNLSYSDYTTGTLNTGGMVSGSYDVTGLATSWAGGTFPVGTDITYQSLYIRADMPYGDGIWYPIQKFNSNTSLTLALPVVSAPNITSATTYTIGQIPLLQEDFHDMLVYGALMVYFTSIVKDKDKYTLYKDLYDSRLKLLEDYAGTKQVTVDLGQPPQQVNPNLFIYAQDN